MPPPFMYEISHLVNRGRHALMAAEVDEHLGAGGRVFHHLSPGADAAAVAVVGTWWRGPRAR